MSHHYGRHGPHAWLRWRKRHFRRSMLPMLAQPEIRIIRVRIPIGIDAERVIYIIMANGEILGTSGEEPRDVTFYAAPPTPPFISSSLNTDRDENDKKIVNMAEAKADYDTHFMTSSRYPEGLYIQGDRHRERAEDLAYKAIDTGFPDGRLDRNERERLKEKYIHAYLAEFDRITANNPQIRAYVKDDRESELRKFAVEDNRIQTIGSDDRVSHHKRDLGVLRVISIVYGINVDAIVDDLRTMHMWTDKYTDVFQKNTGREVMWPSADFREQ